MKGIPLLVTREGKLLTGRGYRVYGQDGAGRWRLRAEYVPTWFKGLLASDPVTCRIAREGIHRMYETAGGDWIAIGKGMILYRRAAEGRFRVATTDFRGSRPLYLGNDPRTDSWYFGEYFSNKERRQTVRIFGSSDGLNWTTVYTFPPGAIRHVHNVVWDPYRRGMWVLTGDRDDESGLWFTGDDFRTLDKVYGGSQAFRAVSLLLTPDSILIPSDTPLETNAIRRIDRRSGQLSQLATIPSSAFHTHASGLGMLVTTVGEPSQVNDADHAYVYYSSNGDEWTQHGCYRRDVWSKFSRYFFRYPEIIPVGVTSDGTLHCVGIALRKCGYGAIQLKFDPERV